MRPNNGWIVEIEIGSARLVRKVVGFGLGRGLSKAEVVVLAKVQEEARFLKVHEPHVFTVASFIQGSAGDRLVCVLGVGNLDTRWLSVERSRYAQFVDRPGISSGSARGVELYDSRVHRLLFQEEEDHLLGHQSDHKLFQLKGNRSRQRELQPVYLLSLIRTPRHLRVLLQVLS